jgi:hypothetical protein
MRYAAAVLCVLGVRPVTGCIACSHRDRTRCFAYGYEKHNWLTFTHSFRGVREIFGLHGHRFCNSYRVIKDRTKTSYQTTSSLCIVLLTWTWTQILGPFRWVWVANCPHNQTATSHFQHEQGNIRFFRNAGNVMHFRIIPTCKNRTKIKIEPV